MAFISSSRDVREHGRDEEERARGPQRGEVGDLHQEDTDRGPCDGRPVHEPYHPCRHPLSEPVGKECGEHDRHLRRGRGQEAHRPQHQHHQEDSRAHTDHRDRCRGVGQCPQGGQQDRERARQGNRLPRHGGSKDGGDPLSDRQTGAHRSRRALDAA